MACAGHCLGVAMAPARQLPPSVTCVNLHKCASGCQLVSPLQEFFSHGIPLSGTSRRRSSYLWRKCKSPCFSRQCSSIHGMVVIASQESGTSTLVVQDVEFTWKGQGSEVLLTGDFLNWESKLPLEKGPTGLFAVKQKLAPGKYMYKFIVDGQWQHSPDWPTVGDDAGGFNNVIVVAEENSSTRPAASETFTDNPKVEVPPQKMPPKISAATTEPASTAGPTTGPNPDSSPSPPRPKAAAAVGAQKAAKKAALVKSLPATMEEDVIPQVLSFLQKEDGVSAIDVTFEDNQLQGSFVKNEVPYSFWAFFPDGQLEGSRGFSLTSHGNPPSTIEPFLIDVKKLTADLIVFWIRKRLFCTVPFIYQLIIN